jgi:hypothetical protein
MKLEIYKRVTHIQPIVKRADVGGLLGNAIHGKGVELYARFDKGKNQWLFGMLQGTNCRKAADEINQSMTLNGIDALLAEMKQLVPQETVFLVPPDHNGDDVTPLDEETQKKLAEFCAKHEIILRGKGTVLNQPNWRICRDARYRP